MRWRLFCAIAHSNNTCLCVAQNSESRHNLSYWKGKQYIGVGPGNLNEVSEPLVDVGCSFAILFACAVEQELMDVLFPWGREALPVRPGHRPWSQMCGSAKSGSEDTEQGGGSSWANLNCEFLHLQAVALCLATIISGDHTRRHIVAVSHNSLAMWKCDT